MGLQREPVRLCRLGVFTGGVLLIALVWDILGCFYVRNSTVKNLNELIPFQTRGCVEGPDLLSARETLDEHELAGIAKGVNTCELRLAPEIPKGAYFIGEAGGCVV
jgi:hypothetical protein